MKYPIRRLKRILFNPRAWRIRIYLWSGAAVVGLFALLLIQSSELLDESFIGLTAEYPLIPLIITPIGFMAIAWVIRNYFPGSQGGGVPQTIASLHVHSPKYLLSARILLGKTAMMLAALACGASVGIGGPMVHIGASIMYVASIYARYTPKHLKQSAIMAGGAAAIAAIFSAPLAGMAFAMEEVSRSFQPRRSGVILATVIIAMLVIAYSIGYEPYFGNLNYRYPDSANWLAAIYCGIAGGILGGIFSQGTISLTLKSMDITGKHPYFFAGICGLVIALIGISSQTPVYGTGYLVAVDITQNPEQMHDVLFPFTKMLATSAAFISGIPGGIFGPSIAIGAGLGADLGQWFNFLPIQTTITLGMASYFSGVFQTPVTAAILVLEITGSLDILLPTITATFIAFIISRLICPVPLYRVLSLGFIDLNELIKYRRT